MLLRLEIIAFGKVAIKPISNETRVFGYKTQLAAHLRREEKNYPLSPTWKYLTWKIDYKYINPGSQTVIQTFQTIAC